MSRTAILRQRHPSLTPARAFRQPASVSLPLRSHVIAHRHVLTAACLLRAVGTVHGNADQVVPPAESFKMYEELHSRGAHAELHMLAQAPHGEKKTYDRISERFRMGKSVAGLSRQILDLSLTSQVNEICWNFAR